MDFMNEFKQLNDLQEAQLLTEMALSRSEAIDKCMELGKEFAEYFMKIMNDKQGQDLKHHLHEMNTWWTKSKNIKLSSTKRCVRDDKLVDWFFSAGQIYSDFIEEPYIDLYERLVDALLEDKSISVEDAYYNVKEER